MTLSEKKLPLSQMHMSTLLDCAGEVEAGGHCRHVSGVVARTVTENVSATQSVQVADPSFDQAPVMHGMQVDGSEAPLLADAVPAGHGMQVWAAVALVFLE
jgi:predicted ATPase with chaperone activity